MLTLTFGYKKPVPNDKGPAVFPAMEQNIQQINDHDHNGANSKKLTAASIDSVPQNVLAAAWVALGGGNFKQTINLLPGYDYDLTTISFRLTSTGEYIYPSITKISDSIIDVFANEAVDMTLVYGV